jgi:hypothetical protein
MKVKKHLNTMVMKKNWIYLLFAFIVITSCTKEESSEGGWEKVNNTDLGANVITSIAVSGSNIFAVSSNISKTLYKSADGGTSWTAVTNLPKNIITVTAYNQYIFAGTAAGIYRSADNGANWLEVNTGLPLISGSVGTCSLLVSNGKLYAKYDGDIYTSINGDNWINLTATLAVTPVRGFVEYNGYAFASTSQGVFSSGNNGASWKASIYDIRDINVFEATGQALVAGSQTYTYYSFDLGLNWSKGTIKDQPMASPWVECFAKSGNTLFAGIQAKGVYTSVNNGMSWSEFNTGIEPVTSIWSMTVSDGYLYIGTNSNGIWKRKLL